MYRKASFIMLVFILAFYPALVSAAGNAAVTAEKQENEKEAAKAVEKEETVKEAATQAASEETKVKSTESENSANGEKLQENDNERGEPAKKAKSPEKNNESVKADNTEKPQIKDNEPEKQENTEKTQANEKEPAKTTDIEKPQENEKKAEKIADDEESEAGDAETKEADEETDENDTVEEDGQLDLTQIHGAANEREPITFDEEKGYYVLDLQAGLNNMSRDQVLKEKWVAFALPNGVYVPNVADVPSGVVPIKLADGHSGLAIKIPDVDAFPDSKYVYLKIPLMGKVNDNDPNRNLYLYNVSEGKKENLGQIKSLIKIDFSVMDGEGEDLPPVEDEDDPPADNGDDQADEDLDLTNIHGAANQRDPIQFDFNKGYYVLDLQAGLTNFSSNQVINEKWLAFALPHGVYVPDAEDVPSGIVPVTLPDGDSGLAVKIPNVTEFPDSKYVYHKIPLAGKPDDNDPNLNLYLYNVNVAEGTAESIGQIMSERKIDFSVMNEEPKLDISGSIDGEVKFDSKKHHYNLSLTVEATNNMEQEVSDLYAGFVIPEGLMLVENADTPKGIAGIEFEDGSHLLAVKLPNLKKEENGTKTYQIPIIGKTSEKVVGANLKAYKFDNNTYIPIGEIGGKANVDFSVMNKEWDFKAQSQIVKDFPGLEKNQFGLQFGFNVQNLTLDDVNEVKVQFNVPDSIKVHEPSEYKQSDIPDSLKDFLNGIQDGTTIDLDIEWNGNTATVHLNDLQGTEWNQGFFTAIGESSKSLKDLGDLEVIVTLYRDGKEEVQVINAPFEIVSYQGDGDDDDNNNGGNNGTPGKGDNDGNKGDTGKDNGKDGNKGDTGKNNGKDGNKSDTGKDNGNKGNIDKDNGKGGTKDNGNISKDTNDKDEDNDRNGTGIANKSKNNKNDNQLLGGLLPATASDMPLSILLGVVISVMGALLFVLRRKIFGIFHS